MQTYTYEARNSAGEKVQADIEASNEGAAAKLLAERGLTPLDIKVKEQSTNPLNKITHRIKTKDKILFSRQLSTLINAGLPLVQSLNSVMTQTANKNLRQTIFEVTKDVEGGSSLAESLSKYPRVFDIVYTSLVAAGEASGTLDVSLERLANQQEKDAEVMSKVRGAMIYPLIVLVVLFAIVVFMVTTVLPQVKLMYDGIPGAQLPILTRVLLVFSSLLIHFWWAFILAVGAAAFMSFRWIRTGPGREAIDRLKMTAPAVGPLFMKLYMTRFARTAATLLASGVPMIKMLETTAQAVGNVHVAASINKAAKEIQSGKALSEVLKEDKNFLELVPNMIHIGEQSGSLDTMLNKVADYFEKEVDNAIKAISTIIEPVMMVIVGVMALIVVAAVLLPIYSLAGKNIIH